MNSELVSQSKQPIILSLNQQNSTSSQAEPGSSLRSTALRESRTYNNTSLVAVSKKPKHFIPASGPSFNSNNDSLLAKIKE